MDKFVSYKNYSSAQDEDVPVTPEDNNAIAQGYTNNYVLIANTHKVITIPTDAKFALFSYNADVWVDVGGTAAIPSGDVTDGTGSELNPVLRYLGSATTIGIKSAGAALVSIMFYAQGG